MNPCGDLELRSYGVFKGHTTQLLQATLGEWVQNMAWQVSSGNTSGVATGGHYCQEAVVREAYSHPSETSEAGAGDGGLPFFISIPRTEIVSDGIFLSHVLYTIQWNDMGHMHTVSRRFSEFVNLDEEINAIASRRRVSAVHSPPTTVSVITRPTVNYGRVSAIPCVGNLCDAHDGVHEPATKHWAFCWILSMLKPSHAGATSVGISHTTLPPKTVLRNKSRSFIESRRKQLEIYLRLLLQRDYALTSWPLWRFLKGDSASRTIAEFFFCSQPAKLLHPSRELWGRMCRALGGLQDLAKCSRRKRTLLISENMVQQGYDGEESCKDGGMRGVESCSMWRITHPDVARRLLSLGRKSSQFPLCIQIRVVDLLHLLLEGDDSLQILCEHNGLSAVFRILENACTLLYSVCGRLIMPLESASEDVSPTTFQEFGNDLELDVSSRLDSNSSSCNDFVNTLHAVSAGPLSQRGKPRSLESKFSNITSERKRCLVSAEENSTFVVMQKTCGVPGDRVYNTNSACSCNAAEFSSSNVPLLLLLIDACTSFICRLVDAVPSALTAFLKHPDGVFRLHNLLRLRTAHFGLGYLRGFDRQENVVTKASSDVRSELSTVKAFEHSLPGAKPTIASTVCQGHLNSMSPWLSTSTNPSTKPAFLNYFTCQCESPCSPQSVCRQREEVARRFVLKASPVVSSSLPSTLSQAFVAGQVAAGGQPGDGGMPSGLLRSRKLCKTSHRSGAADTNRRSIFAVASVEAVESRIHSCIALVLWRAIRLSEVQKVSCCVVSSLGFMIINVQCAIHRLEYLDDSRSVCPGY